MIIARRAGKKPPFGQREMLRIAYRIFDQTRASVRTGVRGKDGEAS